MADKTGHWLIAGKRERGTFNGVINGSTLAGKVEKKWNSCNVVYELLLLDFKIQNRKYMHCIHIFC